MYAGHQLCNNCWSVLPWSRNKVETGLITFSVKLSEQV
jgi:hypothetical protein